MPEPHAKAHIFVSFEHLATVSRILLFVVFAAQRNSAIVVKLQERIEFVLLSAILPDERVDEISVNTFADRRHESFKISAETLRLVRHLNRLGM